MNGGCDLFDQDRPIEVEHTVVQIRGEKPLTNLVINESEHFHPVNDSDIPCPGCGQACAILPEKRRSVPLAGSYPTS